MATIAGIFGVSLILCFLQYLYGIPHLLGGNSFTSPAFPYPGDRVTVTLTRDVVGKDLFNQNFEAWLLQSPDAKYSWVKTIAPTTTDTGTLKTVSPASVELQLSSDLNWFIPETSDSFGLLLTQTAQESGGKPFMGIVPFTVFPSNVYVFGNQCTTPHCPHPGDRVTVTLNRALLGKDLLNEHYSVTPVARKNYGTSGIIKTEFGTISRHTGDDKVEKTVTTEAAYVDIQLANDISLPSAVNASNTVTLFIWQNGRDYYSKGQSFGTQLPFKVFNRSSFKKELCTALVLVSRLPLVVLFIIALIICSLITG